MPRKLKWCPHCRKGSYVDRVKAELALERCKMDGERRDREPVRVYRCPFGWGWHMTSQEYDPRRQSRGGKRKGAR